MIDASNQPDLDAVLDSLSVVKKVNNEVKSTPIENLTDEETYHYLMNKLRQTIDSNAEVMEQTKDLVSQVGTAEYVEAHAAIVKSQSELIKNMVGVVIEKKKLDQNKELKTRDLDLKEKSINNKTALPELTNGPSNQPNGGMFILATREDIFNSMFGSDEDKKKAEQKIKEANGIVIDV